MEFVPAGISITNTVTPGLGESTAPLGNAGSVEYRTGSAVVNEIPLGALRMEMSIVLPSKLRVAVLPLVVTVALVCMRH